MNRRILVVEPDAHARAMLVRVLSTAGFTAEDFVAADHARILLDEGAFDLALVDEFAGDAPLGDVRTLRARYPRVPVVATGALLATPTLLELLRLGVLDAVPKPYTPAELRSAVARALARAAPRFADARDFAAAIESARHALAGAETERAASALARAYGAEPFDALVATLQALRAELRGDDDDAARGYRAALALRHHEGDPPPDPRECLARLEAYGDARPVDALRAEFHAATLCLVPDARDPAASEPAATAGPVVRVYALGLLALEGGRALLRQGATRAFALLPADLRAEHAAPLLARISRGPIVAAGDAASAGVDVARIAALRDACLSAPGAPSAAATRASAATTKHADARAEER